MWQFLCVWHFMSLFFVPFPIGYVHHWEALLFMLSFLEDLRHHIPSCPFQIQYMTSVKFWLLCCITILLRSFLSLFFILFQIKFMQYLKEGFSVGIQHSIWRVLQFSLLVELPCCSFRSCHTRLTNGRLEASLIVLHSNSSWNLYFFVFSFSSKLSLWTLEACCITIQHNGAISFCALSKFNIWPLWSFAN